MAFINIIKAIQHLQSIQCFCFKTNRGSAPARYMAAILIFYMMALFWLVVYLSKDMYYFNTANYYFAMPKFIWKWLTLLTISRTLIIRMCNFCVLGVLYLGICFSLSFMHPSLMQIAAPVKRSTAVLLIAELLFYDPAVEKQLYYALYPSVFSVAQYDHLQKLLHGVTVSLNLLLVVLSFDLLFYTLMQTSRLHMIRLNIFGVIASYLMVMCSYLYIFLQYPCHLIRFSKLANTITYLSAPLISSNLFYRLFPYFTIGSLLLISLSIYKSNDSVLRMRNDDFSISKQIAASDITSRTFCHFMKNELLAIEAELDELQTTEEGRQAVQNVIDRCEHLYRRLDVIHRNTRSASLTLHKEQLASIMTDLIAEQLANTDVEITCNFDQTCPSVMLDRNYFEQAVMNIITNALEAMQQNQNTARRLSFSLNCVNKWVILSVADSGPGIPPEILPNIFTPFYTSQPVARHWGVGLSLTHKIIAAHEGHIEVESHAGTGTTFRIMLPAVH